MRGTLLLFASRHHHPISGKAVALVASPSALRRPPVNPTDAQATWPAIPTVGSGALPQWTALAPFRPHRQRPLVHALPRCKCPVARRPCLVLSDTHTTPRQLGSAGRARVRRMQGYAGYAMTSRFPPRAMRFMHDTQLHTLHFS
ncbi:hypothetical protein VFPFJ_09045 [Purpureocillium lilacinum]|uniref:Uncharacterized protein n=1 Tax=Purpureocillium lilacinum TaxID=33203 RepID=A0A179GZK9_PURLI|nr:hypothetical protein VFPFJ_09045 [Purpureocillium lilacinum]OAQ83242.1 hypothetical protein VFPFJ_09045 [Purpureocillium lilacinum]